MSRILKQITPDFFSLQSVDRIVVLSRRRTNNWSFMTTITLSWVEETHLTFFVRFRCDVLMICLLVTKEALQEKTASSSWSWCHVRFFLRRSQCNGKGLKGMPLPPFLIHVTFFSYQTDISSLLSAVTTYQILSFSFPDDDDTFTLSCRFMLIVFLAILVWKKNWNVNCSHHHQDVIFIIIFLAESSV